MNRRQFLRTSFPLASPLLAARPTELQQAAPQAAAGGDGWIPLFNGRNLDGWYTFLQRSGRGAAEKNGYVSVENGLLHIMGRDIPNEPVESGYLSTLTEYENVRIRVEYKWGVKRFAPRLENKRDNGLLYYVVGPDRVWPTCVECQIQETDTGDVFFLGGTRGIQGTLPGNGAGGFPRLITGATGPAQPTSARLLKDGDFERLDDWNTVEVIARGNRASHLVNGRIVNLLQNLEQADTQTAGQFVPIARGRIAIEIEFAEVWFRRIDVKPL